MVLLLAMRGGPKKGQCCLLLALVCTSQYNWSAYSLALGSCSVGGVPWLIVHLGMVVIRHVHSYKFQFFYLGSENSCIEIYLLARVIILR